MYASVDTKTATVAHKNGWLSVVLEELEKEVAVLRSTTSEIHARICGGRAEESSPDCAPRPSPLHQNLEAIRDNIKRASDDAKEVADAIR